MKKKEIFDALDDFSQNLFQTIAEVDQIKTHLKKVIEENTNLRLENEKLRQRLGEMIAQEEKQSKVGKNTKGRDGLEAIYDDGFHVCNAFYGQRLDAEGTCMLCDELLYR